MLDFLARYGPAEALEDGQLATPGMYVTQAQSGRPVLLCRTPGAPPVAAIVPVRWVADPFTAMRWPIATAREHASVLLDFTEYGLSVVITRYGGDVAAITPIHHAATQARSTP